MGRQQRAASSPEVYPHFHGGHISITGGSFSQDNQTYKSYVRVDSQTFDNSTNFNGPVSGYIHRANTTGPVIGMQETNIGHKDQSLDAGVPRALGTSQLNMPLPIPPIDQDERAHQIHVSPQSSRRSTGGPPPQNRAARRRKKLVPLTVDESLTGGEEHPSTSPRGRKIEDEFSQLSPEMQKFVEGLERKKGHAQISANGQNPVSPGQRRRRSQFHTFPMMDPNSLRTDGDWVTKVTS